MEAGEGLGAALGAATGQILQFASRIAGVSSILSGVNDSLDALGQLARGQLFQALATLQQGAIKAMGGLLLLGGAAAGGGMETFGKVIEYLTTVIGQVATPIFVVLTAAIASVADVLKGPMESAAKSVAEWLGENLVAMIKGVIKAYIVMEGVVDWLIVAFQNFGNNILAIVKVVQASFYGLIGALQVMIGWVMDWIPGMDAESKMMTKFGENALAESEAITKERENLGAVNNQNNAGYEQRQQERTASLEKGGSMDKLGNAIGEALIGNVKGVRTDMSSNMAMKSNTGFSGIGDIQKTIQQQAFKSDFESKTLQEQQKIAQNTDRMVSLLEKKQLELVGP